MEPRNMSVAVIGAGDYIGAAIAKKFAAEGFAVFVGRRHGEKLAPLVAEIEAAGGRIVGRSLDARKEDDLAAFLHEADATFKYYFCLHANETLSRLEQTPKLTIAAINGYAMGGGMECTLSCDIRIMEAHAQMALPEPAVGLLPGGGEVPRLR